MAEPLFFESTGESRQPASAAFCPGTPLTGQIGRQRTEKRADCGLGLCALTSARLPGLRTHSGRPTRGGAAFLYTDFRFGLTAVCPTAALKNGYDSVLPVFPSRSCPEECGAVRPADQGWPGSPAVQKAAHGDRGLDGNGLFGVQRLQTVAEGAGNAAPLVASVDEQVIEVARGIDVSETNHMTAFQRGKGVMPAQNGMPASRAGRMRRPGLRLLRSIIAEVDRVGRLIEKKDNLSDIFRLVGTDFLVFYFAAAPAGTFLFCFFSSSRATASISLMRFS